MQKRLKCMICNKHQVKCTKTKLKDEQTRLRYYKCYSCGTTYKSYVQKTILVIVPNVRNEKIAEQLELF